MEYIPGMPKLSNRTRVIQVLNIPCRPGCDGTGCLCSNVVTQLLEELPDGTKGTRVIERRLPGSVTILAKSEVEVPAWVAQSQVVKQAVAQGRLRLVEH